MSRDELSIGNGVDASTSEDAEVARVLDEYLAELEAGCPADPDRLLAEHPAIASQLRVCLEVMHLAGQVVDDPGPGSGNGSAPASGASAIPLAPSLRSTWDVGNGPPPRVRLHDLDDDEPMVRPRSPAMPATPEGSWGRYQLQGEIARGGMGVVIRGRDVDLGRDLAIKVLLESHRRDPQVVRRFIEEAQIGGQLQHPGIVPVYELGTCADRRPYFAMKLVKGRTLASMLQSRSDPRQDLTRFLSIFEQISQTMAYAHARGVIHRDLKPSNVMVGSFGEVQVMDWGLSKVLARGGVADEAATAAEPLGETVVMTVRTGPAGSGSESQAGSVLGTPAYMAPEQARGEVERMDERTDVFGLGAILCEVLTGRPPYVGSTREEIRDRAARGDRAEAMGRLDTCGADAEMVALARDCLAAEPERRPRDAGEVSRRISAYRAGVQERLKAAELAQVDAQARAEEAQARAVIERSRRRRTLALAASILGLVVVGGGCWAYLARQRMERAARVDRAASGVDLLYAEASRVGDDLTRWFAAREAAHAIEGLLADAPDEPTRTRLAGLVREVTRAAATAETDQQLLADLVDIRAGEIDDPDGTATDANYADAFRDAGMDLEALPPAEAAARIRARPATVRVAIAAALDDWGAMRWRHETDPARVGRLTRIARLADPDSWRDRLRESFHRTKGKERSADLRDLMKSVRVGELPAASLSFLGGALIDLGDPTAAESVLREAVRRYPGDVWINYDLARSLEELGRREEAIRYYTAARSLRPETAHSLAHALEQMGETDRAIAVFQDLAQLRPKNGLHFVCMSEALGHRGRPKEARAALDTAVSALQATIARHPDRPDAHTNLGNAYQFLGRLDEAIAEFRESLRLRPDEARVRNNIGNVLRDQHRLDEAIAEYREALRLRPDAALVHENLGRAYRDQGHLDDAINEYHEAIRLRPDSARAHNHLGNALRDLRRLDEAITEYRTALMLRPDYALAHNGLGIAFAYQGKLGEAMGEFREAARIKPDFAEAHNNLGDALTEQGKTVEAIHAYREALRLKPSLAPTHAALASALRSRDEWDEAIAEFRIARDLAKTNPKLARELERELRETEQQASLADRLPAVMAGKVQPGDAAESLGFAQLCHRKKLHGASAKFWAEAFRSQPKLAEDMQAGHRYNAACAAALAASGQGKDDPPLDEATKARWRKQALDWLEADLAAWSKVLESGSPQARPFIARTLEHWKADADLAGLRDPAAVAKLPEGEQKACHAHWADVDALLAKARGGIKP